jgi:hypothetical protein
LYFFFYFHHTCSLNKVISSRFSKTFFVALVTNSFVLLLYVLKRIYSVCLGCKELGNHVIKFLPILENFFCLIYQLLCTCENLNYRPDDTLSS